ncbi:N-acetyltransferase B complex non catalytic subunit-domain-containing protein [Lobosporangium transversale]|uniref:N-acetyltransferase B complex non catalytic subunit-domain-containing protein n=1 Tax=Lobosporangium transversale TaxID=64571 RepID=A0A1Y2G7H3_9FUNG|nr:N-acetyltransferase B complex non catalytic subunit-domain-containing protein [Lobosporangium transversale]ORY96032.1 N-acetyltransferase B complex non catalytic subunit-domain-containing protein [Lobosporangium transversale]|eukprot:XP_021875464.1 N-acetyltransferase B complex non catalytic subunit-domain-containing protein [Lobosporangium transversale]
MASNMELERKLKPIYDALEVGNYRESIQLCNKALKKQPDLHIVKALKALSFERSGKTNEALQLCEEIQWAKPTDEATLRTLSMVLRAVGRYAPMIKLYENASKVNPKNENLATQWFMSLARTLDFKGQQMVALQLHKNFKKTKYMFWAIMSITLQGKKSSTSQSAVFYQLAERMMAKMNSEGKVETIEELQLYLIILLGQEDRYLDALNLLEGEIGVKTKAIENVELRFLRIDLLIKVGRWNDARQAAAQILKEINSDDWRTILQYFDTIFLPVQDADLKTSENLTEARTFFSELVQKEGKNPKRGPFLAQIELEKRVQDKIGDNKETVMRLMIEYFDRFGSKSCCFEDLSIYISSLDNQDSLEFCKKLRESVVNKPETVKEIAVQINIARFERFVGQQTQLNSSEATALVNKFWKLYEDSLPFGKDLEETERQYGDDYVIMAAHLLIDLHRDTKSYFPLLNATFMLEHALNKSKHNYQIKLVLIRIYELLGAYNCATNIYNTMAIKHVQHDTLSHFITDRASNFGLFDLALAQLYSAHDIYHSTEAETPEMILQAYKYSTFSKMEEFIEFQSRLENSLQKIIADREIIRLEILKEDSVSRVIAWLQELEVDNLKYDAQFCESRIDNRDTTVMLNWNPKDTTSVEVLTRPAPQPDLQWMILFTLVPRLLKHMACLSPVNAEYENHITALENLISSSTSPPSSADSTDGHQQQQHCELTTQEIKLGQIMLQVTKAYQVLFAAIVAQNSNSSTKEEPSKTASTVKEHLSAVGALLKRDPVKSIGVLSWQTFHVLTMVVETVTYLNVSNQSFLNLIANKANKKSIFKPVNVVVQDFMAQCRQALQVVQTDVTVLRNVVKPDRIKSGLLYELCDGSAIDFVRTPAHQTQIEELTLKIGASWMNSLINLQQQAISRAV